MADFAADQTGGRPGCPQALVWSKVGGAQRSLALPVASCPWPTCWWRKCGWTTAYGCSMLFSRGRRLLVSYSRYAYINSKFMYVISLIKFEQHSFWTHLRQSLIWFDHFRGIFQQKVYTGNTSPIWSLDSKRHRGQLPRFFSFSGLSPTAASGSNGSRPCCSTFFDGSGVTVTWTINVSEVLPG